jgi:exopolyphosphatase/guanosine-5'-triphosphate,3'-diphosphate pyrophosphatase
VFDIGGGSTEIVHGAAGDRPSVASAISANVGSVRLFERHLRTDPPAGMELQRVRDDIRRALDEAPAFPPGAALVGVAGTVTTLAMISLGSAIPEGVQVHGTRVSAFEISRVARLLESLTVEQRAELAGLERGRADVIVVGALLVEAIVERSGTSEIVVSDRGVRWGLAEASLAEPRES